MNRPYRWGGSVIASKHSFPVPAPFCGRQAGSLWKADIPPMLAAQSAFPSAPLVRPSQNIRFTNLEMILKKKDHIYHSEIPKNHFQISYKEITAWG
jgi:hypothetical protein